MEFEQLCGAVEAVLFAAADPITAEKAAEAIGVTSEDVLCALEAISQHLDSRTSGICLMQYGDRYQFTTRNCYSEAVKSTIDSKRLVPLSQAAMEVLAIVAYNQPVSRSFIEQVRGVDSTTAISGLVNRGLLAEAGRLDLPGRPIAFKTTDTFLRTFGVSDLSELPAVRGEEEQPIEKVLDSISESPDAF